MISAMKLDEIAAVVFIDIAIIIVVARLMGALFKRIRQPPVVGEIIGGIMLGPSLLGLFPGDLPLRVFPLEVRPFLTILAQVGLIIFMFIVGLELDTKLIRGKERVAAVVSVSSVALPFGLGMLLALYLHASHDEVLTAGGPTAVDFLPFALFIGASMSVTAFPVLARILTERGMYRTQVGALALACAAVDDILAWSLLAVVLAVVSSSSLLDLPLILVESLAFVAVMFLVVRPQLKRLCERYRRIGRLTPDMLAVVLVGILVSSYITSEIGIHSIFGAFLFGVIMPREHTAELFHEILMQLERMTVLLLLPVFFVATGLNVDITGLRGDALLQLLAILAVAITGKFVGATVAARAQGIRPRRAAALGVLMNTRGLTELVILNVGRSFGVLDDQLFTMLVVMAIVTTIMTEPLLRAVYPDKQLAADIAEAEREASGDVQAYRVLLPVSQPARGPALVGVAHDLVADEHPSEVVLTRIKQAAERPELGSGLGTDLIEVANALDEMRALSAYAGDQGVTTTVRAQLADDPTAELVAQVAATHSDVVLLDLTAEAGEAPSPVDLDRLLADGAPTVLALAETATGGWAGPDRGIVVRAGNGAGGAMAVQMALRIGRARGAEVGIVEPGRRRTSRRADEWGEQLERAGVRHTPARVADGDAGPLPPGTGLLILGGDGAPPPVASLAEQLQVTVMWVRAGELVDDGCIERLVDKLIRETADASSATGEPEPVPTTREAER
ncbi:MAG: cation:proton antiporter [Acidimicrobiales bacterium]